MGAIASLVVCHTTAQILRTYLWGKDGAFINRMFPYSSWIKELQVATCALYDMVVFVGCDASPSTFSITQILHPIMSSQATRTVDNFSRSTSVLSGSHFSPLSSEVEGPLAQRIQ